jgi:hypothetical protein
MLTLDPECPAYAEYLAQSPLRVVPGAVVFVVLFVPLEEHATRTVTSAGAPKDATHRRRLPFIVMDSSSTQDAGCPACKRYHK